MTTQSQARAAGAVVPSPRLPHVSWSSIETYKTCPKKFSYRYIVKAEEERTAASLAFGGAIHKALETVHQRRLEGRSEPGLADLVCTYQAAWNQAVKENPDLCFNKNENPDALLDMAGGMLAAYLEHLKGEAPDRQTIAIEHEAHFQLLPDAPPIKARIDLVEIVGDALVVTDWKTSRNKWSAATTSERLGQLIVYSYALMPMLKALGVKRVVPRFLLLRKLKKPKIEVIEPKATQKDAQRLKELVSETWSAIEAGVFPRRESWACENCPYKYVCLGR